MNLHLIDWTVVISVIVLLLFIAFTSMRYTKSAADFLAANRCAGRYLLGMAEMAAGMGAVGLIASWEMYYSAGFSAMWWSGMVGPVWVILSLSGWITYRYRATRAMTMAQFFEIRYSKKVRLASGIIAWLSGIINYGIFPAVTSRFLIYLCGIPISTVNLWGFKLNLTLAITMFIMLGVAIAFTFMGGLISIMITDFFQGQFFCVVFIIVLAILWHNVGWTTVIKTLQASEESVSMINPFKSGKATDFNAYYFMTYALMLVYGYKAWQGTQGFNCSAKSPHEARMAGVLSAFRGTILVLMYVCAPICVYVVLKNPAFAGLAENIQNILKTVTDGNVRGQMVVPIALAQMMPIGVLGLMVASVIAAAVANDDTNLHSWGSIFIQDVIMPLKKKPLTNSQHMRLLRLSVIGVAAFAWIFSLLFPLKDYLLMFTQLTGGIYIGGAGSMIIGGLYWKRGTTAGAWAAMIVGAVGAFLGVLTVNVFWPYILPGLKASYENWRWLQKLPEDFPLNGMQVAVITAALAAVSYVVTSLLTKVDPDFDMDRMLHRGKYKLEQDSTVHAREPKSIMKLLGIGNEFTRGDKIIYFAALLYSLFTFAVFATGVICYKLLNIEFSDIQWGHWWTFYISMMAVITIIVAVLFIWGGIRDMLDLFRTLKSAKRNVNDDGTVVGHHNVSDEKTTETIEKP
ncbi:MAG: sodium:solute symporter family protein [Sedimentisphaerales bacterium]